ncbi:MAG: hypothetical protein IJW41_04930 [Oscillospiraceae bacterium]|nr:hypothetical protein [Oscillospiraceae bacterium]
MNEQELQEFTLEDIIKEFGDHPEPEDIVVVAEELPVEEAPAEEAPVVTPEPAPTLVTGDTIRMDAIRLPKGEVKNAVLIEDEEPEPQPEQEEPYSQEWEPDYEQPIGDYLPPPPIIVHPRSRLRELKRKLVAGPEKRYYALMEKGLGKLQAAIFLSFLVVLLCAASTAMYALGMVQENRLKLMVFAQFFAMLVSALLGSFQLIDGAIDLIRKRFSLNTLLLFTFLICCVDGIMGLAQQRIPCCAAFSLAMTMSLWSTYHRRNTEMGQMDTMRKANHLDGMAYAPDNATLLRKEGQVEDFMEHYDAPVKPERMLNRYAFISLLASLCIGIVAGVLQRNVFAGVQVTAVSLLAAVPATTFITISRPFAILARRLHAIGTVICGWKAVEKLNNPTTFPLTQDDLFPSGTIRMNGVKFYGSRSPEEVISYATAVLNAAKDGLAPLFTQIMESRNGLYYDATDLQSYEVGGVGGLVNDETVTVGTLACMRELEVTLPEGIRIDKAVCVAISDELCGVFAVTYEKLNSSASALTTLSAYRKLQPMISGADFMLTESFVGSIFGVKTRKMRFADSEEWAATTEQTLEEDAETLIMTTSEGVLPLAYGITGAKALRSACKAGAIVHMAGGILGLAIMLLLTILGALDLLTPVNMFLYQLVWAIPGLLISEWTRSI